MANKQKSRERRFSAVARAETCAPRPWTIFQNLSASVADITGAVRVVLANDVTIRGMSLAADIIATSVKVDIKVNGTIKLTGTVTVADKAVYFTAAGADGIVVPAGSEISVDVDVTGTCGGITAVLDTIP